MAVEVVTREDLQLFRMQLLSDIKTMLLQTQQNFAEKPEGYKTNHVRKMLDCSTNKLHSLRATGKLKYKKLGGTIYYKKEDVKKLLNEGY